MYNSINEIKNLWTENAGGAMTVEEKKDMQSISDRLKKLRECMCKLKIDAYLILSNDFHNSEYVSDYFKCRQYISGFTGSAGSVLVLNKEAGLWTDGRYFLQAEQELKGSGIELFRMEEEGIPTLEEYLKESLPDGARLGVDGRTISVAGYRKLEKKLQEKNITIDLEHDIVGSIWLDRPQMSCEPAWELDLSYTGKPRKEKIAEIQKEIKEKKADCIVISSLDDIAWTLNIRGNDVSCTPVVLSYLIVEKERVCWFVQKEAVCKSLENSLKQDGITIHEYHTIYTYLYKTDCNSIYLDPNRTNMAVYLKAKNSSRKILEGKDVTLLSKAVKNSVEIQNEICAHIKDAVACTKFIYWLKRHVSEGQELSTEPKRYDDSKEKEKYPETEKNQQKKITEISAAEKLEELRQQQEHYLGPSFDTIIGYAHHGAIVHYSAVPDTDLELKPENFVLVDSGGHYLEGTTDITRTIALGELTSEQKHYYTLILKGNIKLASAKFKYGCAGINLDFLAREALWQEGLDYNHGTGHGVGYLLNVHEPPNSFRSRISESGDECVRLEPGMITSNEPGIYFAEKYGIRIENLMVCTEIEKNDFGQFLGFKTLTLVPFERDAIEADELSEAERQWLNEYNAEVWKKINPYLEKEEREWLKIVTAEI